MVRLGCLLTMVGSTVVTAWAAMADIGTVAAVNRAMDGTPPAGTRRNLDLGIRVVRNERIETSDQGSGQILFLDQTSLSIAPGTDLVLDSYVYDPELDAGEMTMSLGRGALRFIGGRISKQRDVIVRTPTATIGIRGGMCIIRVDTAGVTEVIQIAGEYTQIIAAGGILTLSRPSATATVPPGRPPAYRGLADPQSLTETFRSFEGRGDGGSSVKHVAPVHAAMRTRRVAEVNSGEQGGADRTPVSTRGERPARSRGGGPPLPLIEEELVPTDGMVPVAGAPPLPANFPVAGAVFTPSLGFVAFSDIAPGSILGQSGGSTVLSIPAPDDSSEFAVSFTTGPVPTYFANSLRRVTGFFEFSLADSASIAGLGQIEGHGFADLDIGFYLTVFETGSGAPGGPEQGVAVFGTPTLGQGAVHNLDTGDLPPGANTLDLFEIEPDLPDGDSAPDQPMFLIGNAGEGRFPHPSHALPSRGGRALAAEASIEVDPMTGDQVSRLSVFASELVGTGTGPQVNGRIMETELDGGLYLAQAPIGLLEDADGNTLFGARADYIVASSLHRSGGTGPLVYDPGIEHELGGADMPQEATTSLLTRDPGGAEIVLDPLELASDMSSRLPGAASGGLLDSVMATGFAQCSSGNCGRMGSGGPSGLYALRPGLGPYSGEIEFNFGQVTGTDDNGVGARFVLADDGSREAGIQGGPGPGTAPNFVFDAPASGLDSGAYLADRRFGLTDDRAQVIDGQTMSADFIVASAELAGGASILPGGVDPDPEYLRWGWWSAAYRPIDAMSGVSREDIVHMGTWVAGARPDPADIPFTGAADFAGLAVGTVANHATGETRIVGGDFRLRYDFGTASGSYDLEIAGHNFSGLTALGDSANSHDYVAIGTGPGGATLTAEGGFLSGGGDPVAATAGHFDIDDPATERQVTGVFGGDRQ